MGALSHRFAYESSILLPYLGPDYSRGGCYIPSKYYLGFDMFKAGTAMNNSVFAMESGKVIYIDPNSSWTLQQYKR